MKSEYIKRLETIQNYLESEQIDIAMITDPANVFYYTGFLSDPHERFMALVIDNQKNNPPCLYQH